MRDVSAGKHLSFWIDTTSRTEYPALDGDASVDVAVLGGGTPPKACSELAAMSGLFCLVDDAYGCLVPKTQGATPRSSGSPTRRS